jgi:hypothetical protein
MKDSHCSIIAHALLDGYTISEEFFHAHHLRSHHKRLATICTKINAQIDNSTFDCLWKEKDDGIFWPIFNNGSVDGTPFKLKSGKVTRCGVYVLEKKYRPALRKAIKRMSW